LKALFLLALSTAYPDTWLAVKGLRIHSTSGETSLHLADLLQMWQIAGFRPPLLWFSLAGCHVPTKAALSLPLLMWTGEKKYNKRLGGRDNGRERLTNYCHGQNRLDSGKLV